MYILTQNKEKIVSTENMECLFISKPKAVSKEKKGKQGNQR